MGPPREQTNRYTRDMIEKEGINGEDMRLADIYIMG